MTSSPGDSTAVLVEAAKASLLAPSVFNTQPWRWRVAGDTMELSADPARRLETTDPEGRLHRWTHRPEGSGDGVPPAGVVEQSLRRVPVRDYTPDSAAGLPAGEDVDRGAAYVVIFGMTDRPVDLLRGGEAMSALLLEATAEGLATAPLSDAVEVAWPRRLVQDLLSGLGEPYVVVRLGYARPGAPLPAAPRREPADVITIER